MRLAPEPESESESGLQMLDSEEGLHVYVYADTLSIPYQWLLLLSTK